MSLTLGLLVWCPMQARHPPCHRVPSLPLLMHLPTTPTPPYPTPPTALPPALAPSPPQNVPAILSQFDRRLQERAMAALTSGGVDVRTNVSVVGVTPTQVCARAGAHSSVLAAWDY